MSPGYGFTMPKKKLVFSCPEIFSAAKDEVWRKSDKDYEPNVNMRVVGRATSEQSG
jgi:hypothetical protein